MFACKKREIKLIFGLSITMFMITTLHGMEISEPLSESIQCIFSEPVILGPLGGKWDNDKIETDVAEKLSSIKIKELLWALIDFKGKTGSQGYDAINGDNYVTLSTSSGNLEVWDLKTNELKHTLTEKRTVLPVTIADNKVMVGELDGTIKIWDIYTAKLLHTLAGHTDRIQAIRLADDNKVVTGSVDCTVKVWDICTDTCLQTFALDKNRAGYSVSVTVTGEKVVVGWLDEKARIWNIHTGELLYTSSPRHWLYDILAVVGNKVVVAPTSQKDSTGEVVDVWDINTHKELLTLGTDIDSNAAVAVVDDKVLIESKDKTIQLFGLETDKVLRRFTGPKGRVNLFKLLVAVDERVVIPEPNKYETKMIWSLSINQQGTSEDNSFLWVTQKADKEQLNFIDKAYAATIAEEDFILTIPSEDATVYASFPDFVRVYLLKKLNIKEPILSPEVNQRGCVVS